MAELKPAQPSTLTQKLMEVLFGDQSISDYNIRRIKEAEDFANQQEAFKAAGGGLGAPIPGANPEVPTPGDALVGALIGLGGAGIPPEIARSGQITRIKSQGSRSYRNAPGETGQPLGFPKIGPSKGFAQEKYSYELPVRVTWKDGLQHMDVIKGLNKSHALERARMNWPDASYIEPMK